MDQVVKQLEQLQCPFSLEPASLLKSHWFELLTWLFEYVDGPLFNRLKQSDQHQLANREDNSEFNMFNVITQMCLVLAICDPKDFEIVRGHVDNSLKIRLLESVLECAFIHHPIHQPNMNMDLSYQSSNELLTSISTDMQRIMSNQPDIFPTDMDPIYSESGQPNKYSATLSHERLDQVCANLQSEIYDMDRTRSIILSELNTDIDDEKFHVMANQELESETKDWDVLEKMKNDLTEEIDLLHKRVTIFSDIYKINIEPWSHMACLKEDQDCSNILALDSKIKDLVDHRQDLGKILTSFESLKKDYEDTENNPDIAYLKNMIISMDESKTLKKQIEVLNLASKSNHSNDK